MSEGTRLFAAVSEVKAGDVLEADDGFTCLYDGERVEARDDGLGLFVPCTDGQHFLDGQVDDFNGTRRYTGLFKASN